MTSMDEVSLEGLRTLLDALIKFETIAFEHEQLFETKIRFGEIKVRLIKKLRQVEIDRIHDWKP